MATRSKSRRRAPRSPSRSSRRESPTGWGPLVWIGASLGGWLVWNLTKPGSASAAPLPQPNALPPSSPEPRAASPSSSAPSARVLSNGSAGADVLAWQTTLVYGGYLPDAPASRDGKFGPITTAATKIFQQKAGVKVDGIVGPETRAAAKRLIPGA